MPVIAINKNRQEILQKYNFDKKISIDKKWLSIFAYPDTISKIIFDNVPENVEILIFGGDNNIAANCNIHIFPIMPFIDMYSFYQHADYIVTRGEVSFSQVLQLGKPFLWDMYHEIGGFPTEQSEQYLEFMNFSAEFADFQKKFWHDKNNIEIEKMIQMFENERKNFPKREIKNFALEVKKYLDNYQNSI